MTRNRIVAALGAILAGVIAWAWIDGGREPVHTIVEPIPVPEAAR